MLVKHINASVSEFNRDYNFKHLSINSKQNSTPSFKMTGVTSL